MCESRIFFFFFLLTDTKKIEKNFRSKQNKWRLVHFFAGASRYMEFNSLGSLCVYHFKCNNVDLVV